MKQMNQRQIVFIVIAVLLTLALAACAGFDLGDIVQVKTPSRIQQTTGLSPKLSLNEAEAEYQAWYTSVQQVGARWKADIQRSNEMAALLGQLTLGALDDVGPAIAGIPVLGASLPFLTALGGLFMRRPGDVGGKTLEEEKRAAYNKGRKDALEAANGGAS